MISIVDYGMGNLGSIKNMLGRLGYESELTSDAETIRRADKLILPGVGHFDLAMKSLIELGLVDVLNTEVLERKKPIFGICLGMQLLTRGSEEGVQKGLGWIPADTMKFQSDDPSFRIPHMGWNRVRLAQADSLWDSMPDNPRFYFVHSYYVRCDDPKHVWTTTDYGGEFHSGIRHENIHGAQFHPEKSHKFGLTLLGNFAKGA